jgi:hypothetical protein
MSNDFRLGEDLWMMWDGRGLSSGADIVYYTYTHVDTNNAMVQRALACAIQRDGLVHSIGEGFKAQEGSTTTQTYLGRDPEDDTGEMLCDVTGETSEGDHLSEWVSVTLIELDI